MSKPLNYDVVPESQLNEYEQIAARMKKRDEQLTRKFRRMRIIVRILDLDFRLFIVCYANVGFFCGFDGIYAP